MWARLALAEHEVLDHMGFRVRDLAAARRFYEAAMAAIGNSVIDSSEASFLIGPDAARPVPFIWVGTALPAFWTAAHATSSSPIHLAFAAPNRAAVDAFHRASLAAGGKDNGAPGPRGPEWMHYYAAFVLDPDGNNVEAGVREE